jgi:glycosyltransferase involved in cell wall biosynthesis
VRAAFVYPNPRLELAADVAAGRAPDTGLLGQNHLAALGIESRVHEPAVGRGGRGRGLVHRLAWNARELTLPWELRDADVAITPLANLLPLAARLRRRPAVVILSYGLATTWRRASPARRRLLRASLASASRVLCLSSSQRADLLAATGLGEDQVDLLPLGVDEQFFAPAPQPANGYVLAVGKDLARDYATLARAAESLDLPVRLVAHPRNLEGVRLPPNVQTTYGLSWSDLRSAYAGAACVVLPLRRPEYPFGTEGSGLTALLEAMASARPLVVTDRAIFRDYVADGESCVAVPAEDPAALASAIGRIAGDRELAGRLGARCRELVEECFTTRLMAEHLASVIRGLDD